MFRIALMMLALCLAGCHNDNGTGSNALPTITGMSPASARMVLAASARALSTMPAARYVRPQHKGRPPSDGVTTP